MSNMVALIKGDLAASGVRTSWGRIVCLGFGTAYFITILVTHIIFSALEDTCVADDPAHPEKNETKWHTGKKASFCVVLFGIIGALLFVLLPFCWACWKKYHGL